MNKKQLVDSISTQYPELSKKDLTAIVTSIFTTLTNTVANNEEVSIASFGTFKPVLQKGKSGKVPGTDKTYTTADKMVPRFKAAKAFKDSVASGN